MTWAAVPPVATSEPNAAPKAGPAVSTRGGAGGRVGPATGQGGVTGSELRFAALVAVGLLVALNVADVVTTRLLLDRGGIELNPLSARLLETGVALLVKVVILAIVGWIVHRRVPHLALVSFLWLVAGVYVAVVITNGAQLVAGVPR